MVAIPLLKKRKSTMKKALILSTILLLSHQNTFTAEAAQANPNDAQFKRLASFTTNGSSNFALSPDGTTIATARLGALAVFNTTTREVQDLNIPAPDGSNKGFLGVSFANSGSFVGSTYYPEVWDPKTGKCWVVYTEKESSQYARLSPNGDQLLTIGRTPPEVRNIPVILTARIWDTQTKKPLCVLSADVRLGLLGPDDNFWSDNGKLVALPLEDTIGVWESNNPKALHMLRPTGLVTATAFSPDQTMLASASYNNAINVWCLKTGNCLNVLEGHTQRCRNIFFTEDEQQIITPSLDGTVRVWNPQTGECLKVLKGHKRAIISADFCQKTGTLATGSQDKTVRIWDVNTGKLLQRVPCSGWVDQVAFDERGETLAIGSGKLDTFMTIQVLKKTK